MAAQSKCPKCDNTRFELKTHDDIEGCAYKLHFIQCASCGAVVGVLPYYSTKFMLEKIAAHLGVKLFG